MLAFLKEILKIFFVAQKDCIRPLYLCTRIKKATAFRF